MADFLRLHFTRDIIPGGASIDLLWADVPAIHCLPFAVIGYSLQGVEQRYGLRLDMDKQVFIDHLADKEQEEVLERAAPKIIEYLASAL